MGMGWVLCDTTREPAVTIIHEERAHHLKEPGDDRTQATVARLSAQSPDVRLEPGSQSLYRERQDGW